MKKALPVRIPVYLGAKLISGSRNYDGIIGNLSEHGAYVEIEPAKSVIPFIPRKKLELKFQVSSQKTLNFHCEVVWLYSKRISPNSLINSIGVEIINPSLKYKKFFKTL